MSSYGVNLGKKVKIVIADQWQGQPHVGFRTTLNRNKDFFRTPRVIFHKQ